MEMDPAARYTLRRNYREYNEPIKIGFFFFNFKKAVLTVKDVFV